MSEKLTLGNLEYLILNFAMKDRPFWLKVYESIKKDYFEKKDNQIIFNFFKDYFSKYNELPDISVADNQIGKKVDNESIKIIYEKPPTNIQPKFIYDETLNFILENMMRNKLMKSIDLLKEKKFDQILSEIQEVMKFNFDTSLGINILDVENRYEKIKRLEKERINTGFPILDSILHGGWAKKELYAVAAPPGVGKSIFLANWAVNSIKLGYNALVYTLEIAEERYSQRHDAILTKIPTDELILDISKVKKKYDTFKNISKANMWIKEFPTKLATVNTLRSHFEQLLLYENFKPDIIFVDYAGLMKPSYRVGNDYNDVKTIFEDLRGWAVQLDIPIVTAAQTNRKSLDEKGGTKEIITQAQVSESLGITQTLDMFMTISQSRVEKTEGLINLYIDKHRHGESSNMLKYSIDYRNFLLEEYDI
jgi:replicative DNA helicase